MSSPYHQDPNEGHDTPKPFPSVPPTQQGQVSTQAGGTRWPKVFGIISIVLGGLGIAGGGCGLISIPVNAMAAAAAQQQGGMNPAAFAGPIAWQVFSQILAIALAGLLLAAGIALLKRRPQGVKLHNLWAYIAIPIALISTSITAVVAMQAVSATNASATNQIPPGMMAAIMIPSLLVGLMFGLAYPIIVLVWLRRPLVRNEYEGWR